VALMPARSILHRAAPGRIFHHNLWFRHRHNNARYAALLPRLDRVDAYMAMCGGPGRVDVAMFHLMSRTESLRYRVLFELANRRYRNALVTDFTQVRYFTGRVVVDVDDPHFEPWEPQLLSRPNVAAYVVTDERVARRYEDAGVEKPWTVIPQGAAIDLLDPAEVDRVRATREPGTVVVGFVAAYLISDEDHDRENDLYNVEHLLTLWPAIVDRVREARLWLVGRASESVERRARALPGVTVTGSLAQPAALAHVANFDIALYPRVRDRGIQSMKVAEYMACGVPTVGYDYEVTRVVRDAGAGLLVSSPHEFVDAVATLASDPNRRRQLADAAARYGATLEWRALARRYERDVLDVHLPAV
jgi:glycosyltransferase involved in cell wall biosynthesis